MEMPRPSAPHDKLRQMIGTWRGEERLHAVPWDFAENVAMGHVRNVSGLDGFVIIQDYEQHRGGQVAFRGHGVIWWDPAASVYVFHWFDSMGQAPNEFRGTFDNGVLSVSTQTSRGRIRARWDYHQRGHCEYRMDVSADGETWTPYMEGSYTREG
jgi:hypothetical protein